MKRLQGIVLAVACFLTGVGVTLLAVSRSAAVPRYQLSEGNSGFVLDNDIEFRRGVFRIDTQSGSVEVLDQNVLSGKLTERWRPIP